MCVRSPRSTPRARTGGPVSVLYGRRARSQERSTRARAAFHCHTTRRHQAFATREAICSRARARQPTPTPLVPPGRSRSRSRSRGRARAPLHTIHSPPLCYHTRPCTIADRGASLRPLRSLVIHDPTWHPLLLRMHTPPLTRAQSQRSARCALGRLYGIPPPPPLLLLPPRS